MSYIIGTPLPKDKVLVYSLAHIYGIGLYQAKIICKKAGFGLDSRGKDLTPQQAKTIENIAEALPLVLGQDLRRFQKDKICHLCNISSYRGFRHRKGLPVRGQRTHTNAKRRPIVKC
uniref:ribosomal protein S13 n=1 Tax=Microzonia abyssicola TaxID=217214 RepID=UPI002E776373|nr:ribosomal protein S13 [Syringoderma abyssicola]WBP70374.1 ribosomal protein S13 [Syringoderma abyssicola]